MKKLFLLGFKKFYGRDYTKLKLHERIAHLWFLLVGMGSVTFLLGLITVGFIKEPVITSVMLVTIGSLFLTFWSASIIGD